MKALRFAFGLILAAMVMGPAASFAQRNVVKFDPIGTVGGQYFFAYERALMGPVSLQLGAGLINRDGRQIFTDGSSLTQFVSNTNGYVVVPELRVYLRNCAPRGLYLQGYGKFKKTNKDVQDQSFPMGTDVSHTEESMTVAGGVGLGLHVIILRTLSLDVNAGPQFRERVVTRDFFQPGVTAADFQDKFLDFSNGSTSGMTMRAQFTVGLAF